MKRLLLLLALCLAPSVASAQCTGVFGANQVCGTATAGPPRAISSLPFFTLGTGTFTSTPNFSGTTTTASGVVANGSNASPNTTQDPALAISKVTTSITSSGVNQALYSGISKNTTGANSRATAVFGEGVDTVGGATSFVEGGRLHGLVNGGTAGSGYGVVASGQAGLGIPYTYLVGAEGEVINKNVDATATFSNSSFAGSFVATSSGTKKVDAAFVVNPFVPAVAEFATGFFVPAGSVNTPVFDSAFRSDASTVWGLNFNGVPAGTLFAALGVPNNTPVARVKNAAGSANLNILSVDPSNNLIVGVDAGLAQIALGSGAVPTIINDYVRVPQIFGGNAVGSTLAINATSNGAPSGDSITATSSAINLSPIGSSHSVSLTNVATYETLSFAAGLGFQAGGGTDTNMYALLPTGGLFTVKPNGVNTVLLGTGVGVGSGSDPGSGNITASGTTTSKRLTGNTNSVPTASACAGFTLSTGSSDLAGKVTFTSATSCNISFGTAFTNAPFCSVSPGSAASTILVSTTTTVLSVTFGTANTSMYYICAGA